MTMSFFIFVQLAMRTRAMLEYDCLAEKRSEQIGGIAVPSEGKGRTFRKPSYSKIYIVLAISLQSSKNYHQNLCLGLPLA